MKNRERNNSFRDYIRNNLITITIQVVGAVFIILNLWLASKLSPLAEDIRILRVQVQAMESQISQDRTKIDSIDVLNANLTNIDSNLKEVKASVTRIEDRLILAQ